MPLLGAGAAHGAHGVSLEKTFEVLAAVGGVYLLASYALPWALSITARKLGPGGFFVIVLGSVFFAGWWMDAVGVSNALGAFMTGVLLSTTVFADQIKAAVSNSKRLLLAIFFIAIGMAIDPAQVAELKWELLFYVPSLLLIKFVVLFALAWLFGLGLRSAILTGLLSMPFDEIGYVIFASANASGLLTLRDYTIGITVISLSFVVSPVLINLGYRLTADLKAPAGGDLQPAPVPDATVVVAGYGPVGRVMCAMLERARIPYTAFTADAESLAKATKTRHNVLYGDLTDAELLDAIAIAQRDELRRMGESEVVALAPEGTMSFGHSVLQRLGIKAAETDAIVSSMKAKDYAVLRATGEVEERGSGEGSLSSPPRGARPS